MHANFITPLFFYSDWTIIHPTHCTYALCRVHNLSFQVNHDTQTVAITKTQLVVDTHCLEVSVEIGIDPTVNKSVPFSIERHKRSRSPPVLKMDNRS